MRQLTPGVRNVMHMRAAGRVAAAHAGGGELAARDAAGRFVSPAANGGAEAMARMSIGMSPEQKRWVDQEASGGACRSRSSCASCSTGPSRARVRSTRARAATSRPTARSAMSPVSAGMSRRGAARVPRTRPTPAIPRRRRGAARACPRSRWSGRRRTRPAPAPGVRMPVRTRTPIPTTPTPRRSRGRRGCRPTAPCRTPSRSGSRATRRGRRWATPRRGAARRTPPASRRRRCRRDEFRHLCSLPSRSCSLVARGGRARCFLRTIGGISYVGSDASRGRRRAFRPWADSLLRGPIRR